MRVRQKTPRNLDWFFWLFLIFSVQVYKHPSKPGIGIETKHLRNTSFNNNNNKKSSHTNWFYLLIKKKGSIWRPSFPFYDPNESSRTTAAWGTPLWWSILRRMLFTSVYTPIIKPKMHPASQMQWFHGFSFVTALICSKPSMQVPKAKFALPLLRSHIIHCVKHQSFSVSGQKQIIISPTRRHRFQLTAQICHPWQNSGEVLNMWGWGQREREVRWCWTRQPYCHLKTTARQQEVVRDLQKEIIPNKREMSWHRIRCKTLAVACSWSAVTLASLHLCQGHTKLPAHYLGQKSSRGTHTLQTKHFNLYPALSWTLLSSQPYTARNCSLCQPEPELSHSWERPLPTNHLHESSEIPLPSA